MKISRVKIFTSIGLLAFCLTGCGNPQSPKSGPASADSSATASSNPSSSKAPDATSLKPVNPDYDGNQPSGNNPDTNIKAPQIIEVTQPSDQAGLTKLATNFVKAAEYSSMTGDIRPVKALSAKECDECEQIMDSIKGSHESGKYESGSGSKVELISIQFEGDNPKVIVDIANQASELRDAHNQQDVIPLPAEKTQWTYTFIKEDGYYRVKKIEAVLDKDKHDGQ